MPISAENPRLYRHVLRSFLDAPKSRFHDYALSPPAIPQPGLSTLFHPKQDNNISPGYAKLFSVGRNRVRPQQTRWLASEDVNIDFLLSLHMKLFLTSAEDLRVRRDFTNIAQFHTYRIPSRDPLAIPRPSRIQYPLLIAAWTVYLKRVRSIGRGPLRRGSRCRSCITRRSAVQ